MFNKDNIVLNNQHFLKTQELMNSLLAGDSNKVGEILDQILDSGVSLQSLYVDVLGAIQCSIGEMWIKGEVTIAQEHRSTQILFDHLTRLRQSIRPRKPLGIKAVISSLAGDQHFLGGRMVSDLLYLDGWDVDFLGADTPAEELIQHCKLVNAQLVGLSVSDPAYLDVAKQTIQKLRSALPDLKIIIGGRAIMNNNSEKIGADVVVSDGSQAVAEARKVVGVVNNNNALFQTLGEIGSRIHSFRKSQKMSQEKLAQSSGLDRAYISSVENGKQNVTIGALLKLSDALGIEISDLIAGSTSNN